MRANIKKSPFSKLPLKKKHVLKVELSPAVISESALLLLLLLRINDVAFVLSRVSTCESQCVIIRNRVSPISSLLVAHSTYNKVEAIYMLTRCRSRCQ